MSRCVVIRRMASSTGASCGAVIRRVVITSPAVTLSREEAAP